MAFKPKDNRRLVLHILTTEGSEPAASEIYDEVRNLGATAQYHYIDPHKWLPGEFAGDAAIFVGRERIPSAFAGTPWDRVAADCLEDAEVIFWVAVEEGKPLRVVSTKKADGGEFRGKPLELPTSAAMAEVIVEVTGDLTEVPRDRSRPQPKPVGRLRSGEMTLRELISTTEMGPGMNESDRQAFRQAAGLARAGLVPLDSYGLLLGYLLTAPWNGENSEGVLLEIFRAQFARQHPEEAAIERERWRLFSESDVSRVVAGAMASPSENDQIRISAGLGAMLERSVAVAREAGRNQPFSTRHLLLCLLGVIGDELDPKGRLARRQLRVDLSAVRRSFRDWFAQKRPNDITSIIDHWLGVSASQAKGAWPPSSPSIVESSPIGAAPAPQLEELRERLSGLERELGEVIEAEAHDETPTAELERRRLHLNAAISEAQSAIDSLEGSSGKRSEAQGRQPPSDRPPGITGVYTERSSQRPGELIKDSLNIEGFVTLFAELIAARATSMPLSIGLFGDWGSGKSHFMEMLRQKILALAREGPAEWAKRSGAGPTAYHPEEEGPWCKRVVTIRFNAWSYLDANLWASLVSEIFDKLFHYLSPEKRALEAVQALLENASGATARAAEDMKLAAIETTKARSELAAAEVARSEEQTLVHGLLHGLNQLVPDLTPEKIRSLTTELLGQPKSVATVEELQATVEEARKHASKVQRLWATLWKKDGRRERLFSLAVAAGASVLLAWLTVKFAVQIGLLRDSLTTGLARLLALAAPLAVWLRPLLKQARGALDKIEEWQKRAEKAQREAPASKPVLEAQEKVVQAQTAEAEKKRQLEAAKALEAQLREEAATLEPGRRLGRFIEERSRSADYRGQLGLVSLARRDFEQLSDLFTQNAAHRARTKDLDADLKKKLTQASKLIDRIVLFVDDLDRCQPEKVIEVLQAVHLLLAFDLFTVVVGVDQRCLKRSLHGELTGLLSPHAEAWRTLEWPRDKALSNGKEVRRTGGSSDEERPATPLDYLEKIFQIPFHLPKMGRDGFGKLMDRLTGPPEAPQLEPAELAVAVAVPGEPPNPLAKPVGSVAAREAVAPREADQGGSRSTALSSARTVATAAAPALPAAAPGEPEREGAGHHDHEEAGEPVLGIVPLQPWERLALKDYHKLIATPRAATRFLNTYRLVRAGLQDAEWNEFAADGKPLAPARSVMLLLAAAAGSPSVAREWFAVLLKAPRDRWTQPTPKLLRDVPEWRRFAGVRRSLGLHLRPAVSRKQRSDWIECVRRFAF